MDTNYRFTEADLDAAWDIFARECNGDVTQTEQDFSEIVFMAERMGNPTVGQIQATLDAAVKEEEAANPEEKQKMKLWRKGPSVAVRLATALRNI